VCVAQYARDVTTEGQATINEEQKLGPDAITHQIPWWATRRLYQRNVY
jgi:hypothetical protein